MSTEIIKASTQVAQFNFFDNEQFATMQRVSTMFANSELVPDMYKISDKNPKEKAIANCMIAIECAQRIGASALMVMQNMVIIYGRPSWSSKFLIATVNTCGRYQQLKYKFENLGKIGKMDITEYQWQNNKKVPVKIPFDGTDLDNIRCTAYTKELGSEELLESSEVTVKMAIQEGWYNKAGSKWPNMTKKMLIYRAASFWTNEYAPELSMGMKTAEEESDIQDISFEDITDRTKKTIVQNANKVSMTMDTPATANETPKPEAATDVEPVAKPGAAETNNGNATAEVNPI